MVRLTQDISEVLLKRPQKNRLGGLLSFFFCAMQTVTDSRSCFQPIGRFVAGPAKSIPFHKGFQQHRPAVIPGFPVLPHSSTNGAKYGGSEIRNLYPRKDQKTGVVDHPGL